MKLQPKKKHHQSGFTIIELLVTIVVLGILSASLSVIVNNNATITKRGRQLTLVNSFAENKIEQMRSMGYLSTEDGATDITNELPDDIAAPRNATLTTSPVASVNGLKLIELEITYNDSGQPRTETYKTYLGELGVGQY